MNSQFYFSKTVHIQLNLVLIVVQALKNSLSFNTNLLTPKHKLMHSEKRLPSQLKVVSVKDKPRLKRFLLVPLGKKQTSNFM